MTRMVMCQDSWLNESHFHVMGPSKATSSIDQKDQAGIPSDNIDITMTLLGSSLVGMNTKLSMSHSVTRRRTEALLLCQYSTHASYISYMIRDLAPVITHPAAIPTMLLTLYHSILRRRISSTWHEVLEVELSSGQSGIALWQPFSDNTGVLPLGNCDDPDISKKAIRETQLAVAWNTYVPRGTALVAAVKAFLESYTHDHVQQDNKVTARQCRILSDYLQLSSQESHTLHTSAQHLLERARIQVEAINNHLSHTSNKINRKLAESSERIAMDARRDSSSMKSIAVLTMTFLPATYIATLFATPGVASTAPSQGVYWAITLPITAVVLLVWAVWTYISTQRLRSDYELAKNHEVKTTRPSSPAPTRSQSPIPALPGEELEYYSNPSRLPRTEIYQQNIPFQPPSTDVYQQQSQQQPWQRPWTEMYQPQVYPTRSPGPYQPRTLPLSQNTWIQTRPLEQEPPI
ncbi:hypothetical protein B0T19DRAFT_435247 [Cercophora scortea]|uniref:Uncharacterized protein n=1 Tax=Cercophora scortea TaxID=314031 RepID=A0AAE0M348_9PEZI|nr:hypothetical protein B0T19DRAFT_435247 [Cercophora scortea]